MLGGSRIGNHAVETTFLLDDSIKGASDTLLRRHIAVLELQLPREAFQKSRKRLCWFRDV